MVTVLPPNVISCMTPTQIQAAVLVLLGGDDRRVPPSQGRYLYHTLKAMGKETK